MTYGTHSCYNESEQEAHIIILQNIVKSQKNRNWIPPPYFHCNFGAHINFNFGAQNFISLLIFRAQLTNFPTQLSVYISCIQFYSQLTSEFPSIYLQEIPVPVEKCSYPNSCFDTARIVDVFPVPGGP